MAKNVRTHTGTVHAPNPSRSLKIRGQEAPLCVVSKSALYRLHYMIPTDEDVTCSKCLAKLDKANA